MEYGSEISTVNDSSLNCTLLYDSTEYKILAGLRASAGFLSFLCCAAVVLVIVLFKKYSFFAQRLILNIAVAAMIHSLSYTTARVNYYTVREIDDPYCYFGGVFNHYTSAVELISIWFTTVNIFSVGMFRRNIAKFEPVYYVATYALPLLWFWIPIWLKAYGTSGGWCGIKSLDANCEPFHSDTFIQFGIWFAPLYISTFVIIVMLVAVAVKLAWNIHKWRGPVADAAKQALKNEIRPLIIYPVLYLLLNTFSLIGQIYHAINPMSSSAVLYYLRVLTSPFRGAFIAVVFALDKDTRARLHPFHWKKAFRAWLGKEEVAHLLETTTIYTAKEEAANSTDTGYQDNYQCQQSINLTNSSTS
jgi:hypothetical protein